MAMFDFVYDAFSLLFSWIVELMLYSFTEKITKDYLAQAYDNKEKQAIWMSECAVLFVFCPIVYIHHTPYFLLAMASFALIYTIFLHNLDLRSRIRTIWQDFCDHEESLRCQNNNCVEGPSHSPSDPPLLIHPIRTTNQMNPTSSIPSASLPVAPMFNTNNGESRPQSQADTQDPVGRLFGPVAPLNRPPVQAPLFQPQEAHDRGSNLNSNKEVPGNNKDAGKLSAKTANIFQSVREWFRPPDGSHPPGLVNPSHENLCFINCVLQALSRTINLREHIQMLMDSGLLSNLPLSKMKVLQELQVVFRRLTMPNEEANSSGQLCYYKSALDSADLRNALSVLCTTGLVASTMTVGGQGQQDAAEFLLWLLDTLHDALNLPQVANSVNAYARPGIHQAAFPSELLQTRAQMKLGQLRSSFNNPAPPAIIVMKRKCIEKIEAANGQESSTYMGPVLTFSNLDWLIYKSQNNSVIDDLFTGQIVSACFCKRCCHMSVTTDTFRILTVPVPRKQDYKSVDIIECFNQLMRVEQLSRRRCDYCNDPAKALRPGNVQDLRSSASHFQTSTPNGPVQRRPEVFNSVEAELPSPIGRANHDPNPGPRQFPPSTPMSDAPTDSEKQTSLRQLPECLIVQLLRFEFNDQNAHKVDTAVVIPAEPIDLSFLVKISIEPHDVFRYSLYGLCLHMSGATMQSGHYCTYSLASDGKWYFCNDDSVRKVDIKTELDRTDVQESVYLLFYRRV